MSDYPNSNQERGPRWQFDLMDLVIRSLAVSAEVYLHRCFGARYLGASAFLALIIIPFFAVPFPGENPGLLYVFAAFYCMLLLWNRLARAGQPSPGPRVHTHYNGQPRLLRLLPFLGEQTIKYTVEPLFTFLMGALALKTCKPLGLYLMVSGLALAATNVVNKARAREQLDDLTDSYLEQKDLAERFRERMRD